VPLSRADAEIFCRDKQHESLGCFYGENAFVHPAWLANQPIYWLHHSFSYGPAIPRRAGSSMSLLRTSTTNSSSAAIV
jgi:hypothetical protein